MVIKKIYMRPAWRLISELKPYKKTKNEFRRVEKNLQASYKFTKQSSFSKVNLF